MDLTANPDLPRAADAEHPQQHNGEPQGSITEPPDHDGDLSEAPGRRVDLSEAADHGVALSETQHHGGAPNRPHHHDGELSESQHHDGDLSDLQRYAEALITQLAADGTAPPAPPSVLDVRGHWLAPAIEALLLILSGEDALDPLTRAAQLDQANTALFLCLSLAVSGHGDRIHASWLGTAFGELSTDRPVEPGQRALWMAAARGAYGPAGKIFVLRKLDAAAVSSTAEPDRWLTALVPGDPPPAATAPSSTSAGTGSPPNGAASPTPTNATPAPNGTPSPQSSAASPSSDAAPPPSTATSPSTDAASPSVSPASPPSGTTSPSSDTASAPTGTASASPAGSSAASTPSQAVAASPEAVAQALAESPALSALPALAEVSELTGPVQAAARLARLLERCTEITATRPAATPRPDRPGPWPDTEPVTVLRALIGFEDPGPLGSLTSHLLEDVRSGSDPHLAAIAFHVAAPVVRAAAEDLAQATRVTPPDEIIVPIHGHDVILRPEGADEATLAAAEAKIRAEGAARLSGRWLVYAPALLPIVAVVLAFTVSELFAVAGLVLGGVAGYILWRRSVREQAEARRVETEITQLREQAEAAMWALHDYAREAGERADKASENLTALSRLLRRGPAVATDHRP
ncbi:hypothetical protein [Sphaerisporangium rhizosphaerae]|uniref:Uncharacterized protein n=1 Tax=Sphaerisporangium rhizosphaerae TaxID=2269375 RepID=A0ABW2PGS7_9ACTN